MSCMVGFVVGNFDSEEELESVVREKTSEGQFLCERVEIFTPSINKQLHYHQQQLGQKVILVYLQSNIFILANFRINIEVKNKKNKVSKS